LSKEDSLVSITGSTLLAQLHNLNLFMVGVGALGCELMKNLAMLGVATQKHKCPEFKGEKSMITITDPDSIELSNLTR